MAVERSLKRDDVPALEMEYWWVNGRFILMAGPGEEQRDKKRERKKKLGREFFSSCPS
jgi:hypothetical protein